MDTINISRHATGLTELSLRHHLPVEEIIDRILQHGIDREYAIFDWSPSPLEEEGPALVENQGMPESEPAIEPER